MLIKRKDNEMSIADYDKMIDIIENNLKKPTIDIIEKISCELGMTEQNISIFYKCMSNNDDTLNQYIKRRKMNNVVYEVEKNNMNLGNAALEYGFSEYNSFYKSFCNKFKISPKKFIKRNKNFEQGPKYLNVLMEELYYAENSSSDEHIDFSYNDNDYSNSVYDSYDSVIESDAGVITIEEYDKFAEIEKYRIIYGLEKEQIVKLYNNSVTSNIPLDVLCEIYTNKLLFDELYEDEPDEEVYDKEYMEEYYCDEMTLSESWGYFQGDDETEFEFEDGKYVDELF